MSTCLKKNGVKYYPRRSFNLHITTFILETYPLLEHFTEDGYHN